ncbi:MAG: ATP-dependent DNA helicase RecG [Coriobacteriia bacterium]|nr:ATP-dependent DNA helicase RecG [Coriobacteriia bacterium]
MAGNRLQDKQGKPAAPQDRLSASLCLEDPASTVKQVSPTRAAALAKLGVFTVRDLVTHFPRRYLDLSETQTVAGAVIGNSYTIAGQVHAVKLKRPNVRMVLTEITLVDNTGTLIITCFRQPWLADQLKAGDVIAVAGKVEFDYGFKRMVNPFVEKLEDGTGLSAGRIIPVHPACEKISAAWMRRIVGNALEHCQGLYDPLPLDLRLRYRFMSRQCALRSVHFPQSMAEAQEARRRLAYEELLLLELRLMDEAAQRSRGKLPVVHKIDGQRMRALAATVPFTLTEDQAKAKEEVLGVLSANRCANHLVLGDVGTGKTIVAAFAAAAAADTGGQALFMAPTEVLARQHGATLGPLFDAAGITYEVLTGSTPADQRVGIIERVAAGTVDVLIGTHALLEPDVAPRACTLVIIDEQQRFGVDQRQTLLDKGTNPDALYLTATPIPRTLALALYGNLTLSYLSQKPHATTQRTTTLLHKSQQGKAFDAAKAALAAGRQVYVVCPLVGLDTQARDAKAGKRKRAEDEEDAYAFEGISIESDDDFDADNLSAATAEAEFLQTKVFPDYRVELLHGKLSSAEKQQVMGRFHSGETQVLVATTVIEVGVDVPNATVMIIQDADRFGLSQLHQLRGRVGRGTHSAQVFLISASQKDTALERLRAMETTDDGFKLASFDLSLRREGDILGNRQHGASALKLVNVVRDGALIEAAQKDARAIMEADPALEAPEHAALAREMRLTFSQKHVAQGG